MWGLTDTSVLNVVQAKEIKILADYPALHSTPDVVGDDFRTLLHPLLT